MAKSNENKIDDTAVIADNFNKHQILKDARQIAANEDDGENNDDNKNVAIKMPDCEVIAQLIINSTAILSMVNVPDGQRIDLFSDKR
ncbi:unnamed protein product [Hermetia illucens]|uniref:Uncharacterized protein n=1 Tax=Hermetia illucens TaxID=343691 RepID=A0A7R8UQB3_HERIL|nr:unnamed protein product [Hermetia illucens]